MFSKRSLRGTQQQAWSLGPPPQLRYDHPYVWPRPFLLRCQRDQTRFLDPVAPPDTQLPAELECSADYLLPVVRYDRRPGERSLDLLRWGLVPYWAKDLKVGFANINAKAEGIESRPAFREAFAGRRCLAPVDNFYEWKKTAVGKQPYATRLLIDA